MDRGRCDAASPGASGPVARPSGRSRRPATGSGAEGGAGTGHRIERCLDGPIGRWPVMHKTQCRSSGARQVRPGMPGRTQITPCRPRRRRRVRLGAAGPDPPLGGVDRHGVAHRPPAPCLLGHRYLRSGTRTEDPRGAGGRQPRGGRFCYKTWAGHAAFRAVVKPTRRASAGNREWCVRPHKRNARPGEAGTTESARAGYWRAGRQPMCSRR